MIKLIASDIDGTLLEEGTDRINPELFSVILELKKRGVYFTAASGRQAASIEHVFKPIRDKIFYIAENGAYVGCYGRVLFATPMDQKERESLIKAVRREGSTKILLCAPLTCYLDTADEEFIRWMRESYHVHLEVVDDILKVDDEIIKISLNRKEHLTDLLNNPLSSFEGRLKYTTAGETWIDVMDITVNKGAALRLLQESLGINPSETMAFGDQLNDLEMLRQAEHSYAVANARPEVLETARYITDTNANDGVLKILKTLL